LLLLFLLVKIVRLVLVDHEQQLAIVFSSFSVFFPPSASNIIAKEGLVLILNDDGGHIPQFIMLFFSSLLHVQAFIAADGGGENS
jgi:hypothetical protein